MELSQLTEAVLVWTGWGRDVLPCRNDSSVVDCFGSEIAVRLIPIIKSLEDDFYSSDARFSASNLEEMGKIAAQQFKDRHPELADEISQAFAWCYTYDFK